MSDGASPRVNRGDILERDRAEPRRHRQPAERRLRAAVVGFGADVHLVLLAPLVVGRHRVAADEQPQRFGGVGERHAEVGRLRPIHAHRQLRLADVERRVGIDDAGNRLHLLEQQLAVRLQPA